MKSVKMVEEKNTIVHLPRLVLLLVVEMALR